MVGIVGVEESGEIADGRPHAMLGRQSAVGSGLSHQTLEEGNVVVELLRKRVAGHLRFQLFMVLIIINHTKEFNVW